MCGYMGRQSGAQEMVFAARQKGFQPHSASPATRLAGALTPEPESSTCDVVRLLALFRSGHWDDDRRESEDSASGLAHIGAYCMWVLAPSPQWLISGTRKGKRVMTPADPKARQGRG